MILVLSHAADVTADFACARLEEEGAKFVRIDTDFVIDRARFHSDGSIAKLVVDGDSISAGDVSCVLLRRPRPMKVEAKDFAEATHTSAGWAEALEGFLACVPPIRWINHPTRAASASRKIEQLVRASRMGFDVPKTLITQDENEARSFVRTHRHVIVKTLSGGYVERATPTEDTLIYTTRVLPEHVEHLGLVSRCPTLFQAEIEKAFDVRVTFVDGRFSAVSLRKITTEGHQITDIRRNNWRGVAYERMNLPESVEKRLASMLADYGLRFAAVDFAVDFEGRWIFFEVNAGGQWAWLDLEAGTDIAGDLAWAMTRPL